MKIAILIGAALLGAAGLGAVPADAQRHGWDDRHDRGRHHDRDWRGDRRGGYGYDRGRGRSRIVCRTVRSHYGRERRCFRVHR